MTVALPARFMCAAGTAIRTADAFFAALFGLVDIPHSGNKHGCENNNNNQICHNQFAPLNAYLSASSLSAFLHRYTRMAAKMRTATSPGTNPAPMLPVVTSVPIW